MKRSKKHENDHLAMELLRDAGGRTIDQSPASHPAYPPSRKTMQELLDTKDSKVRALEERILELKKAEDVGDLCWMDYNSWLAPGNAFQLHLRATVDPAFWGSPYFEYSRFVKHLPELIGKLDGDTIGVILRCEDKYQVILYSRKFPKWEQENLANKPFLARAKRLASFEARGLTHVDPEFKAPEGCPTAG